MRRKRKGGVICGVWELELEGNVSSGADLRKESWKGRGVKTVGRNRGQEIPVWSMKYGMWYVVYGVLLQY